MRVCPTKAIRVREGKAKLIPELCIDCGSCLRACPSGAIQATTQSFAEIDKFKYKVAVPSPVLFGQFPMGITPGHIARGLLAMGFDAVWDFSVEIALANRAILEYVRNWKGTFPLISNSCPVIVRLVQVLYPRMIDQLLRVQLPRELAARELKRKYSEELGIDRDDVAAIYITPCQAKTISILEPAEGAKSNLDGALGISDVYNDILALTHTLDKQDSELKAHRVLRSAGPYRWTTSEGQARNLSRHRYLSVTGLANIIQVFEDIYKGKLRNIEYLECYACWGGCPSGNLAVDNIYVSLSKIHRLLSDLPDSTPEIDAEVDRRYATEDFSIKGELKPRVVEKGVSDLKERVKRVKVEESVRKVLPGLDCGLCGAPTCEAFAKDVAEGAVRQTGCVFFSDERLEELREIYLRRKKLPFGEGP